MSRLLFDFSDVAEYERGKLEADRYHVAENKTEEVIHRLILGDQKIEIGADVPPSVEDSSEQKADGECNRSDPESLLVLLVEFIEESLEPVLNKAADQQKDGTQQIESDSGQQ